MGEIMPTIWQLIQAELASLKDEMVRVRAELAHIRRLLESIEQNTRRRRQ